MLYLLIASVFLKQIIVYIEWNKHTILQILSVLNLFNQEPVHTSHNIPKVKNHHVNLTEI